MRNYQNFFGTLGEIGGILDIVFISMAVIYGFYNSYFMEKHQKKGLMRYKPKTYHMVYDCFD